MDCDTAKKIIEKNRESYNRIAGDFDASRRHAWPELEILKKYVKPGMKILDIGCGNGRLYKYLYQASSIKYYGIDNSEKIIEIAKKNYPAADFRSADVFDLPFKGGEFDIVAGIAFLHHIPSEDLRFKILKEIRRVLKPDGVLFLTNWNLWQRGLIKKYRLRLRDFFFPRGGLEAGDFWINFRGVPRYYHHFRKRELVGLCKKAGFKPISCQKGNNMVLVLTR